MVDVDRVMEDIKCLLFSDFFMVSSRVSSKDFVRDRKLPFVSLVLFMVNMLKQTLQKELVHFMGLVSSCVFVTKGAFCQSRLKLKPEAFVALNCKLVESFYKDPDVGYWNGFRLMAIDGSSLEVPKSVSSVSDFGSVDNKSGKLVPMARISTFFDLLNGIIVDSRIGPYKKSEGDFAIEHMELASFQDLVLCDRGYAAVWFFHFLVNKKINFVIRLPKSFIKQTNDFWTSEQKSQVTTIEHISKNGVTRLEKIQQTFEPIKIRLIKVSLDNNEVEVLATNLFDEEKYPAEIFKKIYALRWGIEVNYDHLKNHIEIGNFSGKSSIAIQQDFYANTFINNLQALFIIEAQNELKKEKKDNQYKYKINKNLSLGFMKDRIIKILTNNQKNDKEELKKLFKLQPTPIRPNRTNPRPKHEQRRLRKKHHQNNRRAT